MALAGRRRAPFTPQAPWQGEEQHQLQPGRRPHFPRVAEAISSSATVSALCARGSARWRREGGAGEEKTRWGCDLSTKEEAGEGTEGASLGNFTPKQAYWLYFPCPEPRGVCSLTPNTGPGGPLRFPTSPTRSLLPLVFSKARFWRSRFPCL